MPQKAYTFKVGTNDYAIKLSDEYDSLTTALGLTALGADDNAEGQMLTKAKAARFGVGTSITITHEFGTNGNQRRSTKIICPVPKISSALTGLIGKTWKGKKITNTSLTGRAHYN